MCVCIVGITKKCMTTMKMSASASLMLYNRKSGYTLHVHSVHGVFVHTLVNGVHAQHTWRSINAML